MTVFEYFNYEKQLLEDLKSVKTACVKDAIYGAFVKVLDDHQAFIVNMMRELDRKADESVKNMAQICKGETPEYVKKIMAEFGFYELGETPDDYHSPLAWNNPINVKSSSVLSADVSSNENDKTDKIDNTDKSSKVRPKSRKRKDKSVKTQKEGGKAE